MQPVLIRTAEETEVMMVKVNQETEDAQEIKEGVAKEEAIAGKAAAEGSDRSARLQEIERECDILVWIACRGLGCCV